MRAALGGTCEGTANWQKLHTKIHVKIPIVSLRAVKTQRYSQRVPIVSYNTASYWDSCFKQLSSFQHQRDERDGKFEPRPGRPKVPLRHWYKRCRLCKECHRYYAHGQPCSHVNASSSLSHRVAGSFYPPRQHMTDQRCRNIAGKWAASALPTVVLVGHTRVSWGNCDIGAIVTPPAVSK